MFRIKITAGTTPPQYKTTMNEVKIIIVEDHDVEKVETAKLESYLKPQLELSQKLESLNATVSELLLMVGEMLQHNEMSPRNFVDELSDYEATRAIVRSARVQAFVEYCVKFRDGSEIMARVYVSEESITWGVSENARTPYKGVKLWGQAKALFDYIAHEDESEDTWKNKKKRKRIEGLIAAARKDLGRAWFSGHYEWIASGIPF